MEETEKILRPVTACSYAGAFIVDTILINMVATTPQTNVLWYAWMSIAVLFLFICAIGFMYQWRRKIA